MSRARTSPQTVHARDDRGRPVDVSFTGDASAQCPACLSNDVGAEGAIGFLPVGDRIDDSNLSPIRKMRCRSCRASWMRPGL